MGQYYRPTLITADGRILSLSPYVFDCGAKLTEHSWIGNELMNAAYSLIYKNPKRVAWIGDYANDDYETCEDAYAKAMPFDEFLKYYEAVWGEESEESLNTKLFSRRDLEILGFDTKSMFLVNHDKRLCIDLADFIKENATKGGRWDGWCMNPLSLLTACGNGRGGGDYYANYIGYEDVGIWAFDHLEYTPHRPEGYSSVMFHFNEHTEAAAV